jgi:hypothetical protein
MDWQKKSYAVLSDAKDQENFMILKRILNYIWVVLSTIGFLGVGMVVREVIDGLDRWGERGCGSAQVMEMLAQFQQDTSAARTQLITRPHDPDSGSQLPKFKKSAELCTMLANLNTTSRVEQQRQYSMHAKAAALYGTTVGQALLPTAATNSETAELFRMMKGLMKENPAGMKTPPAKSAKATGNATPKNPNTSDKSKPPSLKLILQTKGAAWQNSFGTKTVKGKEVKLCWFRCNLPTGCNQGNKCKNSHLAFPEAYKNAPLSKLPVATQWSVIASCKKH